MTAVRPHTISSLDFSSTLRSRLAVKNWNTNTVRAVPNSVAPVQIKTYCSVDKRLSPLYSKNPIEKKDLGLVSLIEKRRSRHLRK